MLPDKMSSKTKTLVRISCHKKRVRSCTLIMKSKLSNKFKGISIKNYTYYFFSIKSFDRNKINIDEKLYKNNLIYYIGYVTIKILEYIKINRLNPLYLIFSKVNRYFEEINKNTYLILVPCSESKEIIEKEVWSKFRHLISSIPKNSDDYDKK